MLICGLLQPTSSQALDFHVNRNIGSDTATALQAQNPAEPWATIRHALRSVPDIGGPHTIHVAPGTYNESLESAYPGITLKGAPGTVLEAPPDKTILYIEHADFTLDGVELRGGLHGVRADQADRLTIRNCIVRDATKNGIHATRSESVVVENSEILGNGSRGVLIETAPNAYVRNNLAAFNREWGIEIDGGDHETHAPSTGHILSFNTVTENGHVPTNGGLRFENATGEMRYNVVGANAGRAIKVDSQPTWIHHNLVWDQSLVVDFESDQPPVVWSMIEADPLFVGNGDYRVLPESPAIDAGNLNAADSDIGGSIRVDLEPDTGLADLGRHVQAAVSAGFPPPAQTPAPTPTPAPPSDIEYFVNCSIGDDTRSASTARNPATPWRSIRRGILGAGARNIVTIQDGTCTPDDEIEIDREAVTVRAENSGGVTVVGASGTNAFLIQSDDVTLEGLQIRTSQRGILVATSSGAKISGVALRNLRVEAPEGEVLKFDAITIREGTDILVENNRIVAAGGRGVQLRFTDHSIVRNNLITGGSIHGDASWAIDFENDPNTTSVLPPLSRGNLVIFNTVVGNRQGIRFNNAEGQIHDNIVTDQTVSGIRVTNPGAASLVHHNNSWNNGQNGDNNYSMPSGYSLWASNISVDPLFTNPAGGEFHLQQIDAGDLADSPLLDLGSAPIGIAEVIGSTRTDGAADTGIADPGFHDNGGRLGADVSIVPEPDPTQIYVDCANGDDSRSPWEANRPWDGWATIAKAMTQTVSGDTVSLVGGSCQEAVEIETAGVTLRSETPGAGLIEPPAGRTGIRVEANDVHIIGVTVRSDKEGIRIASEDSDKSLHRVHLESVLVEAPLGTSRFSGEAILMRDAFDSIIEGSIVRQAGGDGIAVNAGEVAEAIGGGSNWIHNNLVTDCDGWGIRVYVRSEVLGMITEANLLSSNTVHGNGSGGIALGSATGEMRHNIVTGNSGFGIKTDTAPLLLHHNLVFGNSNGYDTESDAEPLGWANLAQDPLFKDSAAGDFRLQQIAAGDPAQSPAVDAGSGSVAENFLSGTTRVDGVADQALADLGYHAQANGNLTKATPGSAPENLKRTFYVDGSTGDNTRHGLEAMDAASPWRTIGHALRSKGAQAGDIVAVRAGTYNESVETSIDGVTIQAEPGVTIDAGGDNGFFIEHADITLEGFRVVNARHGIRANQAHRLKVRGNEIPAPSSTGIKITRTDDAIVDSNIIDGAVSRGIHGTDSPNFYVRNNLVTNAGDWSIEADTAQEEDVVDGTTIAFNTVAGFATGGIRLDNATGRVRDNIVFGAGNVGIKTDTAPVDVHHNNILGPNFLFDESSGEEPRRWSNRSEPPGFVDQASGDYRLMSLAAGDPGDSPLLERGSAPAESLEADISGSTTRDGAADTAMADLGYHEMASASAMRPTAIVDFQARAGTGTVFHVAPEGDNNTSTGNAIDPSTPWKTLRYAARQLAPGDTLQIAAGDYAENISLQSAGIRLRGDPTPGATRILPPSGVLGISIEGHDNVEIEDVTIQGGAQSIKAVQTSGLRLLRVASVSPETTGLKAEDSSDIWIDSSVVTDGGETGILLLRSDRIFLRNNRIYGNGGWAVSIDNETGSEEKPPLPISAGNLIAFNTVHANNDGARVVGASAEIRDNIITNHQGLGLYLKGNGIFAHHNVFAFNHRNHDRENDTENIFFWDYIGKSPKYVDPAGPDGLLGGAGWLDDNFALATIRTGQSRNSPIIDKGSMETAAAGIDGSTSTDLQADTGIADPGFHANATPASSVPAETDVDPAGLRSTFFVSSQFGFDGTEDDPRTSATARDPATPWATLHYAVSRATEGDTIILLPGVYRNSIQIERDGITVKAESPDSVLLEPLARENPDTGVAEPTTGFTIEARNITIDGLMIRGASTGISALGGSDGLRIRNCAVLESKGDGIRVFESRDIGIENTISASNLYAGIKLRRSAEAELRNNLVYGNGEWGVSMDNTSASDDYIPPISDGNLLEANTIAYNAVGNLKLDNSAGIIRNNLLTDADGFGIKVETSEIILQHNGFWSPAGPAQAISPAEILFCTECFGNLWADPLFLSPAGTDGTQGGSGWRDDDFRVRQIGAGQTEQSPAVDAGSDQALLLGLTGTTATSGTPDLGMVDLGYHYANGERALRAARWRAADTSAIVYVDAQIGDDQRTRSEAMDMNTPWASLRHALRQVVPGDTLILGAGVWNESMDIRVSDITILGSDSLGSTTLAPGDRRDAIRVRAARVEIRNLAIDGGRRGISLYRQAEDAHLEDLRIENVRSDGIALRATANTTIESATITGCRRTGISATRATGLSIQNVEITACRRGGISMSRSSGIVAFATIHEAGRTGISVRQSPDLEIRDSIVTGHSDWGIHMRSRDGQEASLRHLLLGDNRMDLEPEDPENATDILTNSNPLYLDPEGGDFSLSPESPAIDKGSDTAIALGVDQRSTQAGHGAPDTGMADLGVHR